MKANQSIGIYIHVPFCIQKCLYCDFISFSKMKDDLIEAYFQALSRELSCYAEELAQYSVKSIFFGGGTPSSVNAKHIAGIMQQIKQMATLTKDAEITLEANPGTLSQEKINQYLASGINRVSLGLQTSDPKLLKTIGRIHNVNDFLTSYQGLVEEGIDNINVDIMFGLPGQSIEQLEHTIKFIGAVKPKHISAYALKLEEGTPLFEAHRKGKITLPDEETERAMYHTLQRELTLLGYHQYEISNFALPHYESRHNLIYWQNTPYIGLGVSAHSKMHQTRYHNALSIDQYLEDYQVKANVIQKKAASLITYEAAYIDEKEDLFETIMLGLRLTNGLDYQSLNDRYGIDFLDAYASEITSLSAEALIEVDQTKHNIRLTPLGMDVSNRVFVAFMKD
ncbi:radical SAM family heme chaperone HemW [Fusibacter paucivorans]|uniref:Heme chaperone HemW n=1 Tax=Fusibacter paucivorans TaxID=76009 RepID=A0ABS5PPC9_9FIRM|nr:radical SAM family heme chaperone HemW [Fusibacter paucivorans]MBS7526782.1 radical SAM family heme chaperone HemW [Fusibacter paucivorans]